MDEGGGMIVKEHHLDWVMNTVLFYYLPENVLRDATRAYRPGDEEIRRVAAEPT